jgi:hypothetical protein
VDLQSWNEVQVGRVADVQYLEVVLVRLVHRGNETLEITYYAETGAVADVLLDGLDLAFRMCGTPWTAAHLEAGQSRSRVIRQ